MENKELTKTGKVLVAIIIIIIGMSFASPYFEAKSFNECTGGKATYSTAFFTELRVQDCGK